MSLVEKMDIIKRRLIQEGIQIDRFFVVKTLFLHSRVKPIYTLRDPPHYVFETDDELCMSFSKKTLLGMLVNTEIINTHGMNNQPVIRKLTPEEVSTVRLEAIFIIPPSVIDTSTWNSIKAPKRIRWIYGDVENVETIIGKLCNHSSKDFSNSSTIPLESLKDGSWTGYCWIINRMGKEEDHFILREYLKYVLEIIEIDAKKLGLTYWPLFLVFSKSAPSIEFKEFEMRMNS